MTQDLPSTQLQGGRGLDHDVRGLEVAVNVALRVDVRKRPHYLPMYRGTSLKKWGFATAVNVAVRVDVRKRPHHLKSVGLEDNVRLLKVVGLAKFVGLAKIMRLCNSGECRRVRGWDQAPASSARPLSSDVATFYKSRARIWHRVQVKQYNP